MDQKNHNITRGDEDISWYDPRFENYMCLTYEDMYKLAKEYSGCE